MLLVFGVLTTLTAVAVISRVRVLGRANVAALGWMSEQWLAEHRASQPS